MGQFIAITAADGRSCPAYLAEPACMSASV